MTDTQGDLFDRVWEMYADPMRERIRIRAREIAKLDKREDVTASDAFEAIREFLPGRPFPPETNTNHPAKSRWWSQNVTGFMFVTGLLTMLFGFFGAVPFFLDYSEVQANAISGETQGFLEVAKIFAGALVGGAAATVITNKERSS